jgi:hypothetical protein
VSLCCVELSQTSTIFPAELLVGGIQQLGEVPLSEAALLTPPTRVVDEHPVDQAGSRAGLHADHPGHRDSARSLPRHPDLRR